MTLYDKIKAQRVSPYVQPKRGRPALVLSDAEKIARYEKRKKIKLKSQRQYRMLAFHKAEAARFDQAVDFISKDIGIKLTKSEGLKFILDAWSKTVSIQ